MNFGVEIGEEILCETPEWERLHIPEGCILEVGLHGSSIDWASEGWFAILVSQVSGDSTSGLSVMGTCLGCEVPERTDQVVQYIEEGAVHLCPQDPCGAEDIYVIHATRVRCWTLDRFGADYISAAGKALLKKADAAAKRAAKAASAPAAAPRRKSALRSSEKRKASPPVIAIPSDEGEDGDEELTSDGHGKERRGELKALLTRTKERILGGGAGSPRAPPAEGAAGGVQAGDTASALAKKRLGAGTSLNPYRQTPLMVAGPEATSGSGTTQLVKRLSSKNDPASALLAQAVQATSQEAKARRDKRKAKEKDSPLHQLVELLKGKGGPRKRKRRRIATAGCFTRRSKQTPIPQMAQARAGPPAQAARPRAARGAKATAIRS